MKKALFLVCGVAIWCGCATAPKHPIAMRKYRAVLAINAEGKALSDARECFKTALLSSTFIYRSWDNFANCAKTIPGISYYQGDVFINVKYLDFLTAAKNEGFLPTSIGSHSFVPGTYEVADFNNGVVDKGAADWLYGFGYPEESVTVTPEGETVLRGYKLTGDNWIVLEDFSTNLTRDSYRH